jgi:hypothetical protein
VKDVDLLVIFNVWNLVQKSTICNHCSGDIFNHLSKIKMKTNSNINNSYKVKFRAICAACSATSK